MRQFLLGCVFTLLSIAAAGAWVWYRAPEYLPEGLRQRNQYSPDYRPSIYRWKDDQGRRQITDKPPTDRPYETISYDPATNVVPNGLPTEAELERD